MMGCLMVSAAMELVLVLIPFVLMWSGKTFGDESGSTLTKITVNEDQDVILPCDFIQTSIIDKVFDWKKKDKETKEVFFYQKGSHYNNGLGNQDKQFKGRVFHFQDQLQFGNASIVIRSTKVDDSGHYTCDFPSHQPTTRSQIELIVAPILKDRTGEKIPGALSKPSIVALDGTMEWELLQCEVLGAFPEPTLAWKDSSGNDIPAEKQVTKSGYRYDVTLKATVTKSDIYSCVSTQKEINHQIHAKTYIVIGVPNSGPVHEFLTGLVVWGVVVHLLVLV